MRLIAVTSLVAMVASAPPTSQSTDPQAVAARVQARYAAIKDFEGDFIQTYDDYPVIVMMQFEDLGFCEKGEGPEFVRSHDLTYAGSFPNNTSGGQLSVGQAGAAGGFLGMTEAIRQLTGQAGQRAVKDAQLGLVCGFGMVTYDRCLCTGAVILGRAD